MLATERLITDNLDVWSSAIQIKSAAGRGKSNKLELYGVKKLRELILELAVRGLLVPQDSNDEPASELLKKIVAKKAKLIKEGKIRKRKKLSDVSEDEKVFGLPDSWEYARLNDFGDWGAGATPSRRSPELYGGDIPWFKSGELVGDFISESEEHVTELALEKASLRYNSKGDVLIAMYGATIGKASILSVPATTNQAVCACTPFAGVENVFLLTLLKAYKHRFIGMGAGGAQPNISREKIIATVVALPPNAEQHRIVAKVDELMALCDQLEQQQKSSITAHQTLVQTLLDALTTAGKRDGFTAAWARIAKHFDTLFTTEWSIDQLKLTTLQLAVMGKLVPQDPNDEPARELLKKIAAEKARLVTNGKIKKQKSLPPIKGEAAPFPLPEGWEWARLGSAGIGATGKTPSTKEPKYYDGDIPFIGPGQITPDGRLLSSDKTLTEEGMPESVEALPGDTLMVCIGGSIGKSVVSDMRIAFNQQINAISPMFNHPVYLNIALSTEKFHESVLENASGSATPIINRSKWENLFIPIAPQNEQCRIVEKVEELTAICDAIKISIRLSVIAKRQLADSLAVVGERG